VVLARTICVYLARRHTDLSLVQIGRQLGNRHHATVIAAINKLNQLIAQDAQVRWHGPGGQRLARARALVSQIEESLKDG
jgi:hypothetical protein